MCIFCFMYSKYLKSIIKVGGGDLRKSQFHPLLPSSTRLSPSSPGSLFPLSFLPYIYFHHALPPLIFHKATHMWAGDRLWGGGRPCFESTGRGASGLAGRALWLAPRRHTLIWCRSSWPCEARSRPQLVWTAGTGRTTEMQTAHENLPTVDSCKFDILHDLTLVNLMI